MRSGVSFESFFGLRSLARIGTPGSVSKATSWKSAYCPAQPPVSRPTFVPKGIFSCGNHRNTFSFRSFKSSCRRPFQSSSFDHCWSRAVGMKKSWIL
jgi:hypothetical protein